MKNRSLLIGLLFLFCSVVHSQTEDGFLLGRIVDQQTRKPIPFATIKVIGKYLGVISNDDGGFRIPKQYQTEGVGLEISCMGYEKKEIPFSSLTPENLNVITLKTGVFELLGTTVTAKPKRRLTPRRILKRAIEKIPMNYSKEAFSYVGYYRDYQQKDNGYLNLNEAILKVFDSGFDKNDYTHTRSLIYDYSPNMDFKRDDDSNKPYNYSTRNKIINNAELFSYGGNEFYILRIHDAIRNYKTTTFSYVDVFEKDVIKNHGLTRKEDVVLGDEGMFVIGLGGSNSSIVDDGYAQSKIEGNIRAEGEIYISQSSYAIHKMVYRMYDFTKKDKKSKRTNEQAGSELLYEIAIEYKEQDRIMYPNYLSLHNTFKLKKMYFYVDDVMFDLQKKCVIIKTNNPPIFLVQQGKPNVEVLHQNRKVEVKQIENTYDGIFVFLDDEEVDKILSTLEIDASNEEMIATDLFQFVFSNIIDQNKNVLNKFVYEDYEQYREFFVQQIITNSTKPKDAELFMKKDTPIFKDQPIVKPGNFDEYWMNTPLQSKQQQIK